MSRVVDVLVTRYEMDASDYTRGARDVDDANKRMSKRLGEVRSGLGMAAGLLRQVGMVALVAAGAMAAFGAASVLRFAQYDALVKALEAVEGSAAAAASAMRELREIAKLPGLGFQEALQGYTQLRRADLGREESMRLLRAVGNAIALGGGGRAELQRVLVVLQQIALKPWLQGEELNQLMEARVPGTKIIRERFGTAEGDDLRRMGVTGRMALQALVEGLERMPRAAESAKNALENLTMAWEDAMVQVGGAIWGTEGGVIGSLTQALTELTEGGVFASFTQSVMDLLGVTRDTTGPEFLKNAIMSMMEHMLIAGYAMRNLRENLRGFVSLLLIVSPVARRVASAVRDYQSMAAGERRVWEMRSELNAMIRKRQEAEDATKKASEAAKPVQDVQVQQLEQLRRIERNTSPELRRLALGGGNLGALGVTATELAARSKRGGDRLAAVLSEIIGREAAVIAAEFLRRHAAIGAR